jgi:hypothetical protein
MSRWDAGHLLAESLEPNSMFPMRLSLKSPTSAELGLHFSDAQDWVQSLTHAAKKSELTLEWQEINHRQLGRNKLPTTLVLATLHDAIRWLGKTKELQMFTTLANTLINTFPKLQSWVVKNPHQILKEKDNLPLLLTIMHWMKSNPRPSIYLRQLGLPGINTKFIEQHKKILSDWLDIELTPEAIASEFRGISRFEARYGFKEKPLQVRFRILDSSLYLKGLSDLMITADEFCQLNLDITTVFITENDTNGLAFPNHPKAIVLFGRGYGFDFLAKAAWLKSKHIVYWGDIDTHGFAILNQCRHHLPHTQSLLMDEATLLDHKAHWTREDKPTNAVLTHLSNEEATLYDALINNVYGQNIRLEQEFINYLDVLKVQ